MNMETCPYCGDQGVPSNYRRERGRACSVCYLRLIFFNDGPLSRADTKKGGEG